ncbi:MAG: hypothetical protein WC570_03935 [Patescibacteria group bacterium]
MPDIIFHEVSAKKIDYKVNFVEMDNRTKELLLFVSEFTNNLIGDQFTGEFVDPGINKIIPKSGSKVSQAEITKRKIKFWEELKEKFPEFKLGNYCRENYYKFLFSFHSRLAKYGIFAKILTTPSYSIGAETFFSFEFIYGFYVIDKVETKKIQLDKQVDVNIVYLGDELEINGKKLNKFDLFKLDGQCLYGNVFIRLRNIKEPERNIMPQRHMDAIGKKDGIKFFFGRLPDLKTEEEKAVLALLYYAWMMDNESHSSQDCLESTIVHESVHLCDYANPVFLEAFRPELTSNPEVFLRNKYNTQIHEEMSALLGELQFSPDKRPAMELLVSANKEVVFQDYGHDYALWIINNKFVDYIISAPEPERFFMFYAITKNDGEIFDKKAQIKMQLGILAIQPEIIVEIAKKLREEHKKNYGTFYAEDIPLDVPSKKEYKFNFKRFFIGLALLALAVTFYSIITNIINKTTKKNKRR